MDAFQDIDSSIETREGLFPNGGNYKFYQPVTNSHIKPSKLLFPMHNTFTNLVQISLVCFTGYDLPKPCPNLWGWETAAWCYQQSCSSRRTNDGMFCVFDKEPSFNIRGLCKEAVMEHTPMDPTTDRGIYVNKFGINNTRQL